MSVIDTDTDKIINQYRVEPESIINYHGRHIKSFIFPDGRKIPSLTTILRTVINEQPPENTTCQFRFEKRDAEYILVAEGKQPAVIEEFIVKKMKPFSNPKYDADLPFRNLIMFEYDNWFSQEHVSTQEVHIFEIHEKSATGFCKQFIEYGGNAVFRNYRSCVADEIRFTQQPYPTGDPLYVREERDTMRGEDQIHEDIDTMKGGDQTHEASDTMKDMDKTHCSEDRHTMKGEDKTHSPSSVSEHSTVTSHRQTSGKPFSFTCDYEFLNLEDEGDVEFLIHEAALYNILVEHIHVCLKMDQFQIALKLSIPSFKKSATLKKIQKHVTAKPKGETIDSQNVQEITKEMIENIKFLLIVLSGLHKHLQLGDGLKAVETVEHLMQRCVKLCEKTNLKRTFSEVERPRFPNATLTFIQKKFPDNIWRYCNEFGPAWTTAREDYPLEGYFAPSFRGTFTVNPENYRPCLFGDWKMSKTTSSGSVNA